MQFRPYRVFFDKLRRASWGGILVLLLVGVVDAQAQFATVRGRVVDRTDDQPLPGAALVLRSMDEGRQVGTATDGNGYFVLARITPGAYVLETSFIGYVSQVDTLRLAMDDSRTLDVQLVVDEAEMDEVVVESQRATREGLSTVGIETIRPTALARIPMPSASGDLAAYLQTLPGVVTTGDRGGNLFVRGGTPTQNLVLIDGMPVFQPFHIVGFYSAFPADIVAFADVHAGGFGARYGGRLSSVIDVSTRNGNKKHVVGGASLAPFLGSLRFEAPLLPNRVSVLASVRESVIERVSPEVLGQDLPYRFGDRFVKVHAFLSRTSSLSLTGLSTFDEGDVADTEGVPNQISWRNRAFGAHYIYLPEAFAALAQIRVFGSRLESQYRPFRAAQRDASTRLFGLEAGFVYYLGDTEVRGGLFGQTYVFEYDFDRSGDGFKEFITEGGLYVDVKAQLNEQFRVEPGLRMHSFASRHQVAFEPRVRAVWQPSGQTGKHIFSAAWGRYHQQIIGLYNARDVTDAFVTWAPSPPNASDVPSAMHVMGGWEGQLFPGVSFSLEAFHKTLSNLAFAEYRDELDDGIAIDPVDGIAQGLDVKVEVVRPSFYGAISYGLASVEYEREVEKLILREVGTGIDVAVIQETQRITEQFPPPHDRRHQVNALARVARGPYAVSVRWQFGSGLPFTSLAGFYDDIPVNTPDDTGFRTQPGSPVLVSDLELYTARLPSYHRLDVSLERQFEVGPVAATLQAAVINIYDRDNIFDYDLFAGRRVNQLPLIPSLGLNVEVR